jgi:hypothetical protein
MPKSILAKHYTGRGLERLKKIYDRVNLKVVNQTREISLINAPNECAVLRI